MEPAPLGRKRRAVPEGRRFEKELRSMMYGFGDTASPLPQSTELMEDLAMDYMQRVLQQAYAACEERQRGVKLRGAEAKLKEYDLLFVLRNDPRRHRRVQELLEVHKEQKEATLERPEKYVKDEV